jgi:hypothetical protein
MISDGIELHDCRAACSITTSLELAGKVRLRFVGARKLPVWTRPQYRSTRWPLEAVVD